MSARICNADVFRRADGVVRGSYCNDNMNYGCNSLASWHLQRLPHQVGRWVCFFQVRGLDVTCYAVQDDFGDLQMVDVA